MHKYRSFSLATLVQTSLIYWLILKLGIKNILNDIVHIHGIPFDPLLF